MKINKTLRHGDVCFVVDHRINITNGCISENPREFTQSIKIELITIGGYVYYFDHTSWWYHIWCNSDGSIRVAIVLEMPPDCE